MSIEDRDKASDIFAKTKYVFSTKAPFEEVFPTIEDIEIQVTETGTGVSGESVRIYKGAKEIREYINCSNSLCYNGGISLGDIIRKTVRENTTEFEDSKICQGYEGSPKGKRKYRSCINFFKIKAKIIYRNNTPSTQ